MTMASGWQVLLTQQQALPYYQQLQAQLAARQDAGAIIYPPPAQIFHAFDFSDCRELKVVILGQDPYHGVGQAHGLAFSVNRGIKIPPSLANIFKELSSDIDGFEIPGHGDLSAWAEQGVLLLNTVLTVEQGQAHAHAKLGWETFTDAVIRQINEQNPGCVFMLWGSHAEKKGQHIERDKHLVLTAPHPSPLSAYRGFFGCHHFSQANQWLLARGHKAIDWRLE